MDVGAVREIFESVLPDEALEALTKATGLVQRERKLDANMFIRSAVISAARGGAGRQAAVLETYLMLGGPKVARGASYAWFSEAFENTMQAVAKRALAYARLQPLDLPGWLSKSVTDWHIVDSMTVKLDDALRDAYPGAGDYAALKIHKRYSLGLGTTVDYTITPAREHDAPHLVLDETWRGLGLLADLGYASHKLLRDAERFGVAYVIRLKDNWKPKVTRVVSGDLKKTFLPGADFDALLDDDTLALTGAEIDADVHVGASGATQVARLVGVQHEGTYRYYLTNLPRADVSPTQLVQLYRLRWEIELDNKLDKSNFHIDEIQARTPHTVRALVHAALASSILACLVAHTHRLSEPKPRRGAQRTTAPVHVRTLARTLGALSERISATFRMNAADAAAAWKWIVEHIVHYCSDPNWRRSPSLLDQLRGWRIEPGNSNGAGRKPKAKA